MDALVEYAYQHNERINIKLSDGLQMNGYVASRVGARFPGVFSMKDGPRETFVATAHIVHASFW